jgi:transposase
MCLQARVKLVYLPLYSPDLNPVRELFAYIKADLFLETGQRIVAQVKGGVNTVSPTA